MPAKQPPTSRPTADLQTVIARAGAGERTKIEKHLAACDAKDGPNPGALWRWAATQLGSLTPLGMQAAGNAAWRFSIPDGKYRIQVFALEDPGDGSVHIYLPDVLAEALKAKILKPTEAPGVYAIPGSRETLHVETITSSNTPEPAVHIKPMLGWGRKALRLTLTASTGAQAEAAMELFQLAARRWAQAAS